MKIGLSSASFYPNVNTEDCIRVMKGIGFNLGEIFLNTPSEYEEDFVKRLKEQAGANNFKINSIHAFSGQFEPYLFDSYKRRREDMIRIFAKVCTAANILGAEYYTFHGMRLQPLENLDWNLIVSVYDELSYIAQEKGIKLAQENVSWCMSSNVDFLKYIKVKCKYPVSFTLDIKQSYKAGLDPFEYIEIMGRDIVNVHINDRDEESACLLPGNGNVDYKKIISKLTEIDYSGNGIIEVYRDNYLDYDDLKMSKIFLDNLFKSI